MKKLPPLKTYRVQMTVRIKAESTQDAEDRLFKRLLFYGIEDATITSTEEIKDND